MNRYIHKVRGMRLQVVKLFFGPLKHLQEAAVGRGCRTISKEAHHDCQEREAAPGPGGYWAPLIVEILGSQPYRWLQPVGLAPAYDHICLLT